VHHRRKKREFRHQPTAHVAKITPPKNTGGGGRRGKILASAYRDSADLRRPRLGGRSAIPSEKQRFTNSVVHVCFWGLGYSIGLEGEGYGNTKADVRCQEGSGSNKNARFGLRIRSSSPPGNVLNHLTRGPRERPGLDQGEAGKPVAAQNRKTKSFGYRSKPMFRRKSKRSLKNGGGERRGGRLAGAEGPHSKNHQTGNCGGTGATDTAEIKHGE